MSKKLTRFVLATLLGLVSTLIPQSAKATATLPPLDGWTPISGCPWDPAALTSKTSPTGSVFSGHYEVTYSSGTELALKVSTDGLEAGKKYRFGMYYGGQSGTLKSITYGGSDIHFNNTVAPNPDWNPNGYGYSEAFTAISGAELVLNYTISGTAYLEFDAMSFYEEAGSGGGGSDPEPGDGALYSWGPYGNKNVLTAGGWTYKEGATSSQLWKSANNEFTSTYDKNTLTSPEITLAKGKYKIVWEDANYLPQYIEWNNDWMLVKWSDADSAYILNVTSETTSKFKIYSSSKTVFKSMKIYKLEDSPTIVSASASFDPSLGATLTLTTEYAIGKTLTWAFGFNEYYADGYGMEDVPPYGYIQKYEIKENTFDLTVPAEAIKPLYAYLSEYGVETYNFLYKLGDESGSEPVKCTFPKETVKVEATFPTGPLAIGKEYTIPVTYEVLADKLYNCAIGLVVKGYNNDYTTSDINIGDLTKGTKNTFNYTFRVPDDYGLTENVEYKFGVNFSGLETENDPTTKVGDTSWADVTVYVPMPETVEFDLSGSTIPTEYAIQKGGADYQVSFNIYNAGKDVENVNVRFLVGGKEVSSETIPAIDWKGSENGSFSYTFNRVGTYNVEVIAEAEGTSFSKEETVTVTGYQSLVVTPELPFNQIAGETMTVPVFVENDGPMTANYRIMIYTKDTPFDQSSLGYGPIVQLNNKPLLDLAPGKSVRIDDLETITTSTPGDKYVAVVYGFYDQDGTLTGPFMAPAEAKRVKFSQGKPNVAVSYTIAEGKTAYVEGETISVTATLANSGNVAGTVGEAILYGVKDGGRPVELGKATPSANIAPEASTEVTITSAPLTAEQAGEWEIFVQYKTGYYSSNFTFDSAHQTVTVRAHEYGVEMVGAEGAEEIVAGTPLIVEVTLKNHLDAFTGFRLTAVSENDAIESVEDATVSLGVDEEKTFTLKINFKEDADPIQLFSYVLYNGETPVMEAKGGVNILTPEAPDYEIDPESFAINYPEELEEGTANFDVTVSFKNTGREIEGFNLKVVGSDVAESTVEAVELATDAEGEYTVTVTLAEELGDPMRFTASLVLINEENTTLFEMPMYINIVPAPEEGYEVAIDEARTVIVPAGVEKLQAGIQYVAKTVLNNLGQALKVRVDLIAMGGISILDGEGSQAAQIVGSTEVDLEAGDRDVTVEIPYILRSEGDYTLSLVVTADDPEIDLNPVMIEEPVDVEVVEPEMPSLEEWGLDEDTATEIKTGETWQANVYIKAENAVENWMLVAKGGNVATSNEAVVNLEAGATGNYELDITFDGTTENELGEDVFAYEMYLVNGLIEIPFLHGTVGFIPTYEYDVTFETPDAIEANKAFNVTVNFNNKADRVRDWKANLYVGEDLIGSAAINAAAKTAVEVTVEGEVYTAGEKNFRVDVINNENEVVETKTFTVDVTMTSVAIATEAPKTAAAGKEFEVKATITNDGTEAFEAYTVELLVNDVVVETKTSEEALAADANAEFTFTLTEEPETYNVAVRFTAGEYNKTSEVKPVVVEEVITVAFAAQFAESYEVGDIVATTLTVTNDSRVAVAGNLYTYAKSAESTENSPVAKVVEINLEAGESTEVSVEIKDLAEGTWDVYFILREGDYFSDVIAESGKYTINMVVTPTEVKVGDLVVKAEREVIAGEAWEATVEFANEGIALEGYKLAAYCDGTELESTEVAVAFRETFKHTFEINFSEEAFGPQQVTFYLFNAEKEEVASQIADVTIVDPAPELAGTVVAAQPAEAYVYRTIEVPVTVTNNGDVTFDSYNVYLVVDNEALILTGVAGVEPLAAGKSAVVYPFFRTDEEGIYNVKAVLIANGETIDTSDEIAIDVVNAPVVREPNVTATAEFDNEIYVGETLNVTVTLKNESLPVDFKLTAVGAEVAEATEIEGSLEEGAEETYGLAVKFTDEAYASVPFSVVVTVGNKVFETPLNVTIVDKPEEPRPSVEVPGLEIPVGYHGYAYWTPEEIANFQGAAGMNLNTDYLPTSFTVEGIAMGKALTSPTVSLQEGRSYLLAYFVDNRAAQNSSVKLTAWEGIEGLQIRNNAKDWTIVTVNYTAEEDKDVDVTLGFNLFSGAKATVYGLAVLESDDFVSPVIESEVNTNVADATVRFESEAGWNYTVVTDAEGNATLDVNNNTVYNVVAMKSAYKDSESIVWTAGPVETETLSFELEENAVNELSLFVNDDNAPYNVVLSWDAVTPGSLDPTVEYRVYNNGVHVATVNQPAAAPEMRAAGVVSYDFVGLSKGSYTFGVAAYFPASETETTVAEISYDLVSTGISMIVNDNNVEAIYDLNGRRISKENVEAGMYVIRYANGESRRVMVTK